jgi:hypothetical protein
MGFVFIHKAKKKTRLPTQLEKIGDRFTSLISADLIKGIKRVKQKANIDKIAEAFEKGSPAHVVENIPWQQSIEDLLPGFEKINESFDIAADLTYKTLPVSIQENLLTDLRNPSYKKFISDRFSQYLQDLNTDSQQAIQRIIQRSFTHGMRPKDAAREIITHLGLNDRQSIALMNFQMKLEMNQESPAKIKDLTDKYSDRLLKQRSVMIARTEIANANNQGQLSVWAQAQNEGLMDPETTLKQWKTDRNPCEKICEKMRDTKVKLHEKWVLPNGRLAEVPNDSHPNCYCYMVLIFE